MPRLLPVQGHDAGVAVQPPVPLPALLRALHPGRRHHPRAAAELHGLQRQDLQGQEQPAKAELGQQLEAGTRGGGVPCRAGRRPLLQRADEDAQVGLRLRALRLQRGGVPEDLDHADVSLKLLHVVR